MRWSTGKLAEGLETMFEELCPTKPLLSSRACDGLSGEWWKTHCLSHFKPDRAEHWMLGTAVHWLKGNRRPDLMAVFQI